MASLLILMVVASVFSATPFGVPIPATAVDLESLEAPSASAFAPRPSTPRVTQSNGGMVTITGYLYFNDRRENGLFGVRLDPAGNKTKECDPSGFRYLNNVATKCSLNWAAAQYMVVDIIERDNRGTNPPKELPNPQPGLNCLDEDVLASATIDKTGRYSATFKPREHCSIDGFSDFAIQLRFRARFCGADYCFSMRRPDGEVYRLSHRFATAEAPLRLRGGETVTMPDAFFKTNDDGSTPTTEAVAINYYASIVDTILTVHRDKKIPFFKDKFGEIEYIYPSDESITATTKSAGRIVISKYEYDTIYTTPLSAVKKIAWIDGSLSAHEYGHVLMLRAWGGKYGYDGIGKHADPDVPGRAKDPAPQIAFKEGWADLVAHAVFGNGSYKCDEEKFDDNSTTPLSGTTDNGNQYLMNNEKALCDWYDIRNEGLDQFSQNDLFSMWENMKNMYVNREKYLQSYPEKGLAFCDYAAQYLFVENSEDKIGAVFYNNLRLRVRNLIEHNRLNCPQI